MTAVEILRDAIRLAAKVVIWLLNPGSPDRAPWDIPTALYVPTDVEHFIRSAAVAEL